MHLILQKAASQNETNDESQPTHKRSRIDIHLGQRIRLKRIMRGMSKAKFSKAVGISVSQLTDHENGLYRIDPRDLQMIAKVLNESVAYFFEEMPIRKAPSTRSSNGKMDKYQVTAAIDCVESLILVNLFSGIEDSNARGKVISLARKLAIGK